MLGAETVDTGLEFFGRVRNLSGKFYKAVAYL